MITLRKAENRGHANHGWLNSYHTFSFADYYDPKYSGFRSLRVINEDKVQGGNGFGTHPHENFEIVSYVVSGALRHQDSMGHTAVMKPGDMQRISAGTGIAHSEYNNSRTEPLHFLQIWLEPSRNGLPPSYEQQSFARASLNALTLACSADGRQKSIKLNQEAEIFVGKLAPSGAVSHALKQHRHAWVQLIAGDIDLNGRALVAGDGAMIGDEKELRMGTRKGAHFLLFDLG